MQLFDFTGNTLFWRLTDGDAGLGKMMEGHYDPLLVFLSVLVASIAGFTALMLLDRIRATNTPRQRQLWLLLGAGAMGAGVWGMHFTGMLAFMMPGMEMQFNFGITILSVIPAVVGSYFALRSMSRPSAEMDWKALNLAALPEALGIGTMHYLGMEAMQMQAHLRYDIWLFLLSLVVAHLLAFSALYVRFAIDGEATQGDELTYAPKWTMRGLASVLIGFSVAGMHYTAMSAAQIYPDPSLPTVTVTGTSFPPSLLGVVIFVVTTILMSTAIIAAQINQRFVLLQREQRAAEEANRAKSMFLANMSHELRTPLNAVIGYSEMIQEEFEFMRDNQEPGAEVVSAFIPDLGRIRTAGKHLLGLINDMLDLSKIESGKVTLHVELFDVAGLLENVEDTIRPLAEKNENTLDIQTGEGLRYMRSDFTKLRQILLNLLSNACKFTSGGSVILRADSNDSGDQVVFTIEDTGIGMSPDQLEHVFEAFTQADSSTTREFGGTGLGLTISSRFCEFLDGEIDVDSTPGEGTTFTVRVAADLDDEAAPEASSSDTRLDVPDSQAKKSASVDSEANHVLVIEDDATMRDLLHRVLEREGFEVSTARNGSEGLSLAEKLRPDVITLDVMMPAMDGWTVLAKLKEHPQLSEIPVVMITMLNENSRGYALGADHYLVKPVDRNKLIDVLNFYRNRKSDPGVVLLVEDDEPTRSLIGRVLGQDGWDVVEADNGEVALDKLTQCDPDLVLLDLMMPKMDGFEFLRHFRSDDSYLDVPVVVVTAKELTAEDEERLRASASKVLAKGGSSQDKLIDEIRVQVRKVTAGDTHAAQSDAVPEPV